MKKGDRVRYLGSTSVKRGTLGVVVSDPRPGPSNGVNRRRGDCVDVLFDHYTLSIAIWVTNLEVIETAKEPRERGLTMFTAVHTKLIDGTAGQVLYGEKIVWQSVSFTDDTAGPLPDRMSASEKALKAANDKINAVVKRLFATEE